MHDDSDIGQTVLQFLLAHFSLAYSPLTTLSVQALPVDSYWSLSRNGMQTVQCLVS